MDNMFSDRLKHCMEQKGISGAELSILSGVSAATISRYICGVRKPTSENLSMIASALNISPDYLLGGNDISEGKKLIDAYSIASNDDKRIIWAILEKYGGKYD